MVQSTMGSGAQEPMFEKVKECKCLAMETSTKATGRMISVMAMVGFFMLMVKCIMVNGSMIWLMEVGSITIRTGLRTAGSGKTMSNTVMV